ncbi:MAG: hypothetical protein AAB477_02530 [Patescibacteria group bacterium]
MIQSVGSDLLQMLIMRIGDPFTYHAEALLDYMKSEGLKEIKVNGGGRINFSLNEKEVTVTEKSYAFGKAYPKEVEEFIKTVWPSFSVSTEYMAVDPSRKEMSVTGRVFTIGRVKEHADNP